MSQVDGSILFLLLTVFFFQNNICCWRETKVTVADVICHLLCHYEGSLPCCVHPSTISCLFFTSHDCRRVLRLHFRKQCPWKEGSSRDGAHTVRTRRAVYGQVFSFVPHFWMQISKLGDFVTKKRRREIHFSSFSKSMFCLTKFFSRQCMHGMLNFKF